LGQTALMFDIQVSTHLNSARRLTLKRQPSHHVVARPGCGPFAGGYWVRSLVMLMGGAMLTEALAALASTGGTALVTAMVTDGWEDVKGKFARLFGRGKVKEAEAAAARLEQSQAALAGLSGADLERSRAEQEVVWRTRLGDLLEQDPAAEKELRRLVSEVQTQVAGSAGPVQQRAVAYDRAQQAVLGHGVQNVRFGDQHGR
jgi:hypothetical protein